MTKGAVVAGLLALFLAWRGGCAAVELAREARNAGFGSSSVSLDERVRGAIGVDFALYAALRDETSPEAECLFLGERDGETSLAYNNVVALLYPRRFHALETVPEDWDPARVNFDGSVHVVAFGPWRELDLAAAGFEPLAEGPRFRLWRFVEEGR